MNLLIRKYKDHQNSHKLEKQLKKELTSVSINYLRKDFVLKLSHGVANIPAFLFVINALIKQQTPNANKRTQSR